MIFSTAAAAPHEIKISTKDSLGDSLKFSYVNNRFVTVDGSPEKHSGIEAIKQWLELFVRTVPGKYGIYADERRFGVSTTELIGKKILPNGAIVSEIHREIEEGAVLCPAIRSVYDFSFSGRTITFTVSTIYDKTEAITIEL